MKPQLAVSYPDKINQHQFGGDWQVMMTEGEKPDEDAVVKRNSTSAIRTDSGFRRDDVSQTQLLCETCRAVVATSRGNTTDIHHQLQYTHKDLHRQFKTNVSHH